MEYAKYLRTWCNLFRGKFQNDIQKFLLPIAQLNGTTHKAM